jgi:hypothetical protein
MSNDNDDDWFDKYMRDKQQFRQSGNPNDLPHYEPAHKNLDIEKLLQGVPGNPMRAPTGTGDVDPMAILQQRLANGQHQPQAQQTQSVHLQEGFDFYKMVYKSDAEYKMNVVRKIGQLKNVSNKSFVLRGSQKCYELRGNEVLDLGKIKPEELKTLVCVESPFDGVILVPRSAVVEQGQFHNGKTLLRG